MHWYCGIDVGAVATKAAVINDNDVYLYHNIQSGSDYRASSKRVFTEILSKNNLGEQQIVRTHAAGCGAGRVEFANHQHSDISAGAKGANHLVPSARTVIDVGGRASRVMSVGNTGKITYFIANERCASGSGRFLQLIAKVLQVDIADVGVLSLKSKRPISFATNCAVFGESEAISRVAEGTPKEDIFAGVHLALSKKIASLVERTTLVKDCVMIGGGARDVGLISHVAEALGTTLVIPDQPQTAAALGAALLARETHFSKWGT